MNLMNLFPTPVAKFVLDRNITEEEIQFINSQITYKNFGNSTSVDRYILKHEKMKTLKEFIDHSVENYFKMIYAPKYQISLGVTQSWINYTNPNEFHHKHYHPNSLISGVFYIKASQTKDKINFFKNEQSNFIKIQTEDYNVYNSDSWWIEVNTNDLLIFPSSLYHSVETVKDENRISLSFNTFPMGYIGDEEALCSVHIPNFLTENASH